MRRAVDLCLEWPGVLVAARAAPLALLILVAFPASPVYCRPLDPHAGTRELLDEAAAALKEAKAIAFQTEVRMTIQSLEVVHRTKALLQRPNLVRLEISGAGPDAIIVLDGSDQWH